MKLRVTFDRVDEVSALQALRNEYLDQLLEAQEPSIEVLVPDSAYFLIHAGDVTCGYFIVHGDDMLLELHLRQPYWVFGECVFEQMLARGHVRRALVKSFDHLLLSSCIARHKTLRVKGLLARELVLRELPDFPALQCRSRVATLDDLPAILAVDQQVFAHPERLRMVIAAGYLRLFENDAGVVGFGIARPIVRGRKHVELGIAVDRPFRLKGHAIYIFRSMVEACLDNGLVPVAGVAVENLASRGMGERVGLVARYRLLELTF